MNDIAIMAEFLDRNNRQRFLLQQGWQPIGNHWKSPRTGNLMSEHTALESERAEVQIDALLDSLCQTTK